VCAELSVLGYTVACYPAQVHSLALGLFASLVSPFGGFIASGLNRRFDAKDFGNVTPGHGGLLDIFDCQFVMGSFAIMYIRAFVLR